MKILLLGNTGQLGWELERCLQPLGTVVACDYPAVNMAESASIRKTVRECSPDVIYNATAYTSVDKAESEVELAEAINGSGPGVLAEEARKLDAILIHYSTDYVFDGQKGAPYLELDDPHPLNVYGRSKYDGEQAILAAGAASLILRTSWVYALRPGAAGFVKKVLEWSRRQETLRMVNDQIANPTWARMLAEISAQLLAGGSAHIREQGGLYHLAGAGFASRFEWGESILEFDPHKNEQVVKEMLPCPTSDFPTPAERPLFSALDCSHFQETFGLQLPDWRTALRMAMR